MDSWSKVSVQIQWRPMNIFRIPRPACSGIGFWAILLLAACSIGSHAARSAPAQFWHGLTVSRAGVLEKHGHPYRGIGVNFVGALRWLLANPHRRPGLSGPSIRTVAADFKQLAAYHIPFVRFPALAAWGSPAHRRSYLEKVYYRHPHRYFHAMDHLCALANQYQIGLIPSFFFTRWPDAVAHEHGLAVWNNPKSRTYRIWTHYTVEMVRRYKLNPAIWGWEFGNELNLQMDLPNAARRFHGYTASWGDTHAQMWQLYARFVRLVRHDDAYHIIEAGNSRPRADSWHNMMDHSWKRDTPAQWAYMLKMDNAPFDVISVHEYGRHAPANIRRAASLAHAWHKPLLVGEFGVSGPPAKSRRLFIAMLHAIVQSKVPLAAVWAFDERGQTSGNHDYSITPTNNRRFMLKAIEAANRRIQSEH
ncbi:MAG: hypothetical protein ACP5O1_11385 [Phycisphaerae bacterium]